jgi:hypothetical protein
MECNNSFKMKNKFQREVVIQSWKNNEVDFSKGFFLERNILS